jgi:divinyl protochlorophyllide a 8-vinyl-reductase
VTQHVGRIGPNAILQTYAELIAVFGETRAAFVLHLGTGRNADDLPAQMVDEAEVNAFVRALYHEFGTTADAILRRAGHRTAAYLLANRIPRAAQRLIRALPAQWGLAVLLFAVSRNAWTFAGTGAFSYHLGANPHVRVARCPMCRHLDVRAPSCHFYAGTFEGLVQALIARRARVVETTCEALGDAYCGFALGLPHAATVAATRSSSVS